MKLVNGISSYTLVKLPIPSGKITVRFRQMRGVWQVFAGNTYVTGASDDSPDAAIAALLFQYEVPSGSVAHVTGLKSPCTIAIPA
jgi:hypothetical protein